MIETVWTRSWSRGRKPKVHTDRECHILDRVRNVVERDRECVSDFPVCRYCSGEAESPGVPGKDVNATRKRLEKLDPEDLGLGRDRVVTDGGERA